MKKKMGYHNKKTKKGSFPKKGGRVAKPNDRQTPVRRPHARVGLPKDG